MIKKIVPIILVVAVFIVIGLFMFSGEKINSIEAYKNFVIENEIDGKISAIRDEDSKFDNVSIDDETYLDQAKSIFETQKLSVKDVQTVFSKVKIEDESSVAINDALSTYLETKITIIELNSEIIELQKVIKDIEDEDELKVKYKELVVLINKCRIENDANELLLIEWEGNL